MPGEKGTTSSFSFGAVLFVPVAFVAVAVALFLMLRPDLDAKPPELEAVGVESEVPSPLEVIQSAPALPVVEKRLSEHAGVSVELPVYEDSGLLFSIEPSDEASGFEHHRAYNEPPVWTFPPFSFDRYLLDDPEGFVLNEATAERFGRPKSEAVLCGRQVFARDKPFYSLLFDVSWVGESGDRNGMDGGGVTSLRVGSLSSAHPIAMGVLAEVLEGLKSPGGDESFFDCSRERLDAGLLALFPDET